MKLVFAIPGDMHRHTGGFIYEATVLRELRALGHEVAHLQLPDSFPDPAPADIEATRAALAAVPGNVPILLDGFIPGCLGPGPLAGIAAPLVPIIHHPLGLETGLAPARAARLLRDEAAALRLCARIVVPSPRTARHLTEEFGLDPTRIDIVPPGFAPAPAPDRTRRTQPPLILSVGLLATRKGHDVLLDALAALRDLDWRARIVGAPHDPRVAAALRDRRDARGLAARVAFAGELSDADLETAYGAATIFALATRYEGYGMVFGEAMRRGLPIVASAGGAVPDTLKDAGELVAVEDAAAFAAALRRLLTDPAALADGAARSAARGATLPLWRDSAARVAEALRRVAPVRT